MTADKFSSTVSFFKIFTSLLLLQKKFGSFYFHVLQFHVVAHFSRSNKRFYNFASGLEISFCTYKPKTDVTAIFRRKIFRYTMKLKFTCFFIDKSSLSIPRLKLFRKFFLRLLHLILDRIHTLLFKYNYFYSGTARIFGGRNKVWLKGPGISKCFRERERSYAFLKYSGISHLNIFFEIGFLKT